MWNYVSAKPISVLFDLERVPLAGVLFALEFPYRIDTEIKLFMDAAIASSSAAYPVSVALNFPLLSLHFLEPPLIILPASMIFGLVACGVVYLFVNAYKLGKIFSKKIFSRGGYPFMVLVGGIILGVIVFWNLTLWVLDTNKLILILFLKPISTIFTMNFGGSGVLFFPTIIIGGAWRPLVSLIFSSQLLPIVILIGMSSFSSGIHETMLTPIMFIDETVGTESMSSFILATVVCYFVVSSTKFYTMQSLTRVTEEDLALERCYCRALS